FCAVPTARGPEKSVPPEIVLEQVTRCLGCFGWKGSLARNPTGLASTDKLSWQSLAKVTN
ncbi:MAG: hypothetical protein NZ805_15520, partial [Armatimonadetes bacterium]|nr:hypothetical protein [Armatimonadota bacterium]